MSHAPFRVCINNKAKIMAFRKKYCKTNNLSFQWDSINDFDKLRRDLNEYEIVYAQFCHEDMRGGLYTRASLTALKVASFIPSLGGSTLVPSGHHRYVRFLVHSKLESPPDNPLNGTWGIIERIELGPSVFLFPEGEAASKRVTAKLTKRGISGFPVEMTVSPSVLLGDLFVDLGRFRGDYNLVLNNCINYGLAVWKDLGGELSWADVCGGHATDRKLANPDPEKDDESDPEKNEDGKSDPEQEKDEGDHDPEKDKDDKSDRINNHVED